MTPVTVTAHTPHAATMLLLPVVIAARTYDVLHLIGRFGASFGQPPWTNQPPDSQDALTRALQILIVRYDRSDVLNPRRLDTQGLAYRVSEQPADQWLTDAHAAHVPWPLPITLAQGFLRAYNYYRHQRTTRLPDLTPEDAMVALLALLPAVRIEDALRPHALDTHPSLRAQ